MNAAAGQGRDAQRIGEFTNSNRLLAASLGWLLSDFG